MEKNKTERQTERQDSKLDNFKGNIHTLTKEDSSKGGKTVTPKKVLANSFNSMKTGKHSSRVPHCHTCIIKKQCSYYDPADRKASCKVLDIPGYRDLVFALRWQKDEDFDGVISKHVQKLYLKELTKNDWYSIKDFLLILLKVKESKFKKAEDQTVNIQINNFHNEFTIFKDTTIKILKKHPKIMKEWRDAIESAKQSD